MNITMLSSVIKNILFESQLRVEDINEEFELSEEGYDYLQTQLNRLNKKYARFGIEPITIKINSIEKIYGGDSIFGSKSFIKNRYKITLEGKPPTVDNYTFIAKIEHSKTGENLLLIAANSPVKNLPKIYRTIEGNCDVCGHNRERYNTYILQLNKEDKKNFPEKKEGDLIQVGSTCLKQFLPDISVKALIDYAKYINYIRELKSEKHDKLYDNEKNDFSTGKSYIDIGVLMNYIALTYLVRGKYISKKKSDIFNGDIATADEALKALYDRDGSTFIRKHAHENKDLIEQARKLSNEAIQWMKQQDFTKQIKKYPTLANYFENLQVISRSPFIRPSNIGYLSAIFQSYLIWKNKQSQPSIKSDKSYVGKIGERIYFNGLLKNQKSYPSPYKRGERVVLYTFENLDGNIIKWWSSTDIKLKDGERYEVSGIVKKQEVDKWLQLPVTFIKNARIRQ